MGIPLNLRGGMSRVDLPDFEGTIANDAKLILRVPVGPEYHRIDILCSDGAGGRTAAELAATDIATIKLYIGSRLKYELDIDQAIAREEFYRSGAVSPGDNGVLPLTFARPWMEQAIENDDGSGVGSVSHANQDGPAWGTQGQSNFTVEIVLGSATGITAIAAYGYQRPAAGLGRHVTVLKQQEDFSAAGVHRVQSLDRNPEWDLYALHIASALVTNVELKIDRSTWMNLPIALLHQDLIDAGRTAQTGFAHIDFIHRNRHADALKLDMDSLILELTFSAAPNSYDIIREQAEVQETKAAAA